MPDREPFRGLAMKEGQRAMAAVEQSALGEWSRVLSEKSAPSRTRTLNLLIKSQLLCQLS